MKKNLFNNSVKILSKNVFRFSIETLFLVLAILFFFVEPEIFLNKEEFLNGTGLYFYNSLLQANAAILAIVGVFFIFRIQSLQATIEGNYTTMLMTCVNDYERKYYNNFRNHSLEEKILDVEKGDYNEEYHKYIMQACINNIKILQATKYSIIYPSVILIVAVLVNAVGVLFSNYLHMQGSQIEIKIFLINTLFQIYCLTIVLKGILSAIKN